ncbi:MAG: cytochrome C oxidase subunit IV family protein [Phycisphaerae bacterium]
MSDANPDTSKHVKVYVAVFVALAVFTVLTVLASRVNASTSAHVTVALAIAGIKASLVAAVFMHLKWEKTLILWAIVFPLCAVFLLALMALPTLTTGDLPPGVQMGTWG